MCQASAYVGTIELSGGRTSCVMSQLRVNRSIGSESLQQHQVSEMLCGVQKINIMYPDQDHKAMIGALP